MADAYERSGEFIDVLSGQMWETLQEPVRQALGVPDPRHGPIVDMGAGTGLGTQVLAAACPGVDILAVEPSPIQRAVLLSRCASDAALRDRVTIVAGDTDSAPMPSRLAAVVALNMLGHLNRDDRARFFSRVSRTLAPGAPLVLNIQPPASPVAISFSTFGTVQVGNYSYEGGGSAEPNGPDSVIWSMRYRVRDMAGATVREAAVDYPWHLVSTADLLAELTESGLHGEVGPFDVVRATRAG